VTSPAATSVTNSPAARPAKSFRGAGGFDHRRSMCADRHTWVFFFTSNLGFPITDSNILLTPQDIDDIIAFLRLL
jgi:hypothetical protein